MDPRGIILTEGVGKLISKYDTEMLPFPEHSQSDKTRVGEHTSGL